MPVENASYINQLDANSPQGGESISEGDDHLRLIKNAVKGSFPNINAPVTATPADLNAVPQLVTDVANLTSRPTGNVASCYWNPTANPKMVYSHNVQDVVANSDGNQTDVVFINSLDSANQSGGAAFSFTLTPVSGTGNPTMITLTGAQNDRISFLAWHLVGGTWTLIPPTQVAFSFMAVDMVAGQ